MGEVTRETFKEAPNDVKLNILFDKCEAINTSVSDINKKMNRKIKIDGFCSTVGGFVGGMIAITTKYFLFK